MICPTEAGVGASIAHLRTDLAMFLRMFRTFFRTCPAYLCAVLADQAGEFTFALEEVDRQFAEFCAIDIECDASLHHGWIAFGFTGFCAVFTSEQGFLAGIDT